jgi:hypothetical protein
VWVELLTDVRLDSFVSACEIVELCCTVCPRGEYISRQFSGGSFKLLSLREEWWFVITAISARWFAVIILDYRLLLSACSGRCSAHDGNFSTQFNNYVAI